ncbi:hypothetical protein G9A89_020242 [Geosiphon pyriformis]|nr:hypothetical protein G9A89_020242 [Geosiphon pyriformis]
MEPFTSKEISRVPDLSREEWQNRAARLDTSPLASWIPYANNELGEIIVIPGTLVDKKWSRNFQRMILPLREKIRVMQNETHPYPIQFVGHGINGVYAVFAGLYFKKYKPRYAISVYTFGQPRIGNAGFANYVQNILGAEIFRVTHTDDYVPKQPPKYNTRSDFYVHHQTEYWIQPSCSCGLNWVYECIGQLIRDRGYIEENPRCNVGEQASPFLVPESSSHNGPYFGFLMGLCPSDRPFQP